ncbi:MAG: hypothetical protein HY905_20030 [Deltaproteobacteria bacterium]|nr:hypothetical protein [Deltaproteobacteria bacterium]
MNATKRGRLTGSDVPAAGPAATESSEAAATSDGGAPAAKTRHGLYFFLFFWLPLIALFVFAIVKGREG